MAELLPCFLSHNILQINDTLLQSSFFRGWISPHAFFTVKNPAYKAGHYDRQPGLNHLHPRAQHGAFCEVLATRDEKWTTPACCSKTKALKSIRSAFSRKRSNNSWRIILTFSGWRGKSPISGHHLQDINTWCSRMKRHRSGLLCFGFRTGISSSPLKMEWR